MRSRGFTLESEILIEAAHQGHPTLAVTIPGRYPVDARASHYRAVVDTAKIVVMVAGRLLRKGLYPLGLWRSLQRPQVLVGAGRARCSTGKADPGRRSRSRCALAPAARGAPDRARPAPKGKQKSEFAYTPVTIWHVCCIAASYSGGQAMSVDQLFGKYRRLKKDLSAAYSQPQWNAALVDRLVDEIGQVEKELALQAPIGLRGAACRARKAAAAE